MKNIKIGFIGGGNMAFAIANGLISTNNIDISNITICEISQSRRDFLVSKGFNVVESVDQLNNNDFVFLAVKPAYALDVLAQYSAGNNNTSAVISIVAGITTTTLSKYTKHNLIRIMPNTPTLVGKGMFAISDDYTATAEQFETVKGLLAGIGEVCIVSSNLMDAATAVSGSGPAYVFMFIDAMIGAGVRLGLTRDQATTLTLQTVIGAAEMVATSDKSPSDLKDMVCSPAGTTIEAVYALEKGGFNALIMEAIKKCEEKSRQLSGNN